MPVIATFLIAITSSVAARVFTSLGIGFISYAALSTLTNTVISSIDSSYNSMGGTALNIANLCGFGQAIGIITAAMITRASLIAIKSIKIL